MQNKNRYFGSLFLFSILIISIFISLPDFDIPTVYGGSEIYEIIHTNNDATESGNGVTSTTSQEDDIRTDSTPASLDYKCSGIMFESVAIPQGATITLANINLSTGTEDDIDCNIYGHDVDDSEDFVDDPDIIHTRTSTTATVNWDESAIGEGVWAVSPDITEIIQEIVDREGWDSGNNLTILLIAEQEETAQWYKFKDFSFAGGSSPAKLIVEWDDPVSGVVYPDHVESADHVTNSTHSLDNNGTFAILEHDATIVWDFGGSTVENITAIRWELLHSVTGAMWRLEGSDDKLDWEIIAQMKQSEVADPVGTNKNDSIRWDWNVVTAYRYLKISAIKTVLSDYYIDYICYVIAPPEIDYAVGDYIFPYEVEQWNWKINGMSAGDTNYASRPNNMVGRNMTGESGANQSQVCWVVNSDFDAENMAIIKFGDFYNITSMEVRLSLFGSPQHVYLYVSETNGSNWDLVWSFGGYLGMGWYGNTDYNASYIRYAKLNSTGTGSIPVIVDAFRLEGTVSGGSPPEDGDGEGDFELPSFGDLPEWFALALGIEVFGAGIFLSGIILLMFLLPIVWYGKSSLAVMSVGLVLVGFLVTINWLPTWMILIIILLIAGMYASKIGDWLSPQGKK